MQRPLREQSPIQESTELLAVDKENWKTSETAFSRETAESIMTRTQQDTNMQPPKSFWKKRSCYIVTKASLKRGSVREAVFAKTQLKIAHCFCAPVFV